MKRRKNSGELQRTTEKIEHYILNPNPDGMDRMLSATGTQKRIALSLEALEAQSGKAGRQRKGYKAPLRHAIEKICRRLDSPALQSVLDALENEDLIDDLFGSRTDPIDIHLVEVSQGDETISFSLRNGKERTITFKTVRNLIAQYKKPSHPD